jgi:tetrahydromethanopterin S-methyltransferase subunit F
MSPHLAAAAGSGLLLGLVPVGLAGGILLGLSRLDHFHGGLLLLVLAAFVGGFLGKDNVVDRIEQRLPLQYKRDDAGRLAREVAWVGWAANTGFAIGVWIALLLTVAPLLFG